MKKAFTILIISLLSFTIYAQEENPYEAFKVKWIGKPAPDFKYQDINGQAFMLSELKGKVVLINCWFINCSGCRVEYPGLQNLKNRLQKQGKADKIVLLSLALDSKAELQTFLKKMPLDFYHMANAAEISQGLYGSLGFPTNFIIDQKGIISHIKIGGSPESADDIEYEMLQLLKKGL
ncbi:peroxiredoxin family protein [Emticicia sp. SJ17W-69]|uniref:peroxiredoxin family protein n=1 Tax=Emticicia sp. SJ17W-69 TaxID=3421657 RepID=UPI003EB809FC